MRESVEERFPGDIQAAERAAGEPEVLAGLVYRGEYLQNALNHTTAALQYYRSNGEFEGSLTGNALRALIDTGLDQETQLRDRKSTRLNSSHVAISYAVFCLKKKKIIDESNM